MKSCFLTVGPGSPRQKFLDLCMALHSVLITTVQYRVCDIPVKGLWVSSVGLPMRLLTCHLSHHFAYPLAYLYIKFQLLLGGKGRGGGGYALQSLIITTL